MHVVKSSFLFYVRLSLDQEIVPMPTLGTVSVPSDVESLDDDDNESSLVTTTEEGVASVSELLEGLR
jgi:hypothetical protein